MFNEKLICRILMEFNMGNKNITEKTLDVEREEFTNALQFIVDENFAKDIKLLRGGEDNIIKHYIIANPRLTQNGIKYLENSSF